MKFFIKNLRIKWLISGIWSVCDQGFFALSTFIINFMLAEWLSPTAFGRYSLCFATFLFFGTFQTAFVSEPILIFGSTKYKTVSGEYLRLLLKISLIFGIASGCLLMISGYFIEKAFHLPHLMYGYLGISISAFAIFSMWVLRRYCYIDLSPKFASASGFVNLILNVIQIYLLKRLNYLSPFTVFLVIGSSSLLSSLIIRLNIPILQHQFLDRRDVLKTHFTYAKWSVLSNFMYWIPENFYYFIIPIVLPVSDNAKLRVIMLTLMPLLQLYLALSILLLPYFSRRIGRESLYHLLRFPVLVYILLGCCYYVIFLILMPIITPKTILSSIDDWNQMYPFIGLIPILSGIGFMATRVILSMNRPRTVVYIQAVGIVANILFGILALIKFGVLGILLANAIASLIICIVSWKSLKIIHSTTFPEIYRNN